MWSCFLKQRVMPIEGLRYLRVLLECPYFVHHTLPAQPCDAINLQVAVPPSTPAIVVEAPFHVSSSLCQVGSFPNWDIWAEWNGMYRDDVRKFIKGDTGTVSQRCTHHSS